MDSKVALTKSKCQCTIRGIVEMFDIKKGIYWCIHPDNFIRRLRNFKYCPICGKKL